MRNRIVGGSIFCSNNRRTCLLNLLIKTINEKCRGYTHMLQDNPHYSRDGDGDSDSDGRSISEFGSGQTLNQTW